MSPLSEDSDPCYRAVEIETVQLKRNDLHRKALMKNGMKIRMEMQCT
jgi:hypothetical protein